MLSIEYKAKIKTESRRNNQALKTLIKPPESPHNSRSLVAILDTLRTTKQHIKRATS